MQQSQQINEIFQTMMNARKTLEHCENLLREIFDKNQIKLQSLQAISFGGQFHGTQLPPLPPLPSLNILPLQLDLQKQTFQQSQLSPSSPSFELTGNLSFHNKSGFKSILFPEKDLTGISAGNVTENVPFTFLEIIKTEISKKDDEKEMLEKLPKSIEKAFYSTQVEEEKEEITEILTPLKKNKRKFKFEKFQQNVIKILMNEYTCAKLENREILPMLPPLLKSRLDIENMPPKRSPNNESFTTLISQIKEVQILWIRRNSSKDESLLEPERAYVLSKEFISNYFG
jgi:hypothetical protein